MITTRIINNKKSKNIDNTYQNATDRYYKIIDSL